ncbi:MAG: hypothetical protein KH113_08910 [Bifidobacterium sp.]|nr:hypothetical protein [Bifidobacterium sp.]
MQASAQLKELLHSINRKSYPAYKSLRGAYKFDRYILSIDHVQGDPFASPSHISVKLSHRDTGFPGEYYKDSLTRISMQRELIALWQQQGYTSLLVTHDIEEAVFMATELVLLSPGPGRVLERLPLDFARRYVAGEPVRSIKSDPLFIEQREYVLSRVFEQREAFS